MSEASEVETFEHMVMGAFVIIVVIICSPIILGYIVNIPLRMIYNYLKPKIQDWLDSRRKEPSLIIPVQTEVVHVETESEKSERERLEWARQKQARIDERERKFAEEEAKFYREREEAEKPKETEFRKGYYLEKKLKQEQRDALYAKDFKRHKFAPYGNSGSAYYWVKTRYNESAEHAFFCYLIRDELRKYTDKITLYVNNGPDIVFTHKKKDYCLDVETGESMKRVPVYVKNKFAKYAREHAQSFIFVTKKNLKYSYVKHGIVLTRSTFRKTIAQLFN